MWNLHGIEPETIDYKTMRVVASTYHLRPEIIESTYYLYHYTNDRTYQQMGETILNDFIKYCRTDTGYAALSDIVSKQQRDEMESFALAETFKYFYLLFAPAETLDFDKIVFNTEAHPLRRTWQNIVTTKSEQGAGNDGVVEWGTETPNTEHRTSNT